MKVFKRFLIVVMIAISVIAVSTTVNASNLSDLENFLKSKHVVCGKAYELGTKEKAKITEYLNNNNITNEQAKSALDLLESAINSLNSTNAKSLSDVPSGTKTNAISLIQSAGSKIGLDIKINTSSNTVTIVKLSDKTTVATAQYETDSTGNITITTTSLASSTSSGSVAQTKNTYKTVEGDNQEYNISSGKNLVFRFDADYTLFKDGGKVYIDNNLVDSKNYTSKSGSTVISLNPDYAKTLSSGKHTIKIAYNNNESSTSSFSVVNKATNTNTTNTTNTTNSTNTTNTAQNISTTQNTNTTSDKTFVYTGNNNIAYIVLSLLAVVAVSTAFVKKVYDK